MRNDSDFIINRLSLPLLNLIEQEVEENETIVWMDQPNKYHFAFQELYLFSVGFSDVLCTIICLLYINDFNRPEFSIGNFIIVLFVIPGFIAMGAPVWAIRNASNTVYLLTNLRAIIIEKTWSTKILSYSPDQLLNISIKQKSEYFATLVFETKKTTNLYTVSRMKDIGFIAIENAIIAQQLIEELVDKAKAGTDK